MTTNVGINGFGRIGRQVLRTCASNPNIRVVAINDPFLDADAVVNAIKYDSTAGRYRGSVETKSKNLVTVDGSRIAFSNVSDPSQIPWSDNGAMYVIECSGVFTTAERAAGHLAGGAQRVVIATASADAPAFVLGANEDSFRSNIQVFSAGSCTAAAMAPILKQLVTGFGIRECTFTCVHASSGGHCTDVTNAKDLRGSRCAVGTIAPISTTAVRTLNKVLPRLSGRIAGSSVRVSSMTVSMVDISIVLETPVSKSSLLQLFAAEALQVKDHEATTRLIDVTYDAVISADFVGETRAGVIDATASMALPWSGMPSNIPTNPSSGAIHDDVPTTNFKLTVWYDNERGFAQRLVELIQYTAAI